MVNPVAGRGRGARLAEPLREHLQVAGIDVSVRFSGTAQEATDLARAAVDRGVDAVLVVGGDGMVQLALQALAGSATRLGVIPTGTGNDLARALGIPRRDPLAAADIVIAGHDVALDLGRATDQSSGDARWFSTILCAGFDSRVAERVARMRWPRGRRRYDLATLAELRVFKPQPFTLEIDGEQVHTEGMLVAVGNTASYGGGLRICADADPADGQFQVTTIAPVSVFELLRMFPKLANGTHVGHPAIRTYHGKQVTLAGATGIAAWADGEPVGSLPVTVECVAAAARVYVPPPR